MWSDYAFQASSNLGIVVCAFFCFIMLFGDSRDRVHSILIFSFAMASIMLPEITSQYGTQQYTEDYKSKAALLIGISCLTALSFVPALPIDKKAWIHALVFIFIIFLRIMVLHKLTAPHYFLSTFVYVWYDEALIITSLIQLLISYDSFIAALHRLQSLLSSSADWVSRNADCIFQGSRSYKQNTLTISKASRHQDKDDPMYMLEEIE